MDASIGGFEASTMELKCTDSLLCSWGSVSQAMFVLEKVLPEAFSTLSF